MPSEMPRLSRASAMSSADCRVVPRSMNLDNRYIAPGVSTGSHTDPARIATLIVTAGVVFVRLASRTRPFGSVVRAGAMPVVVTSGHRQRVEPADRAIGRRENRAGGSRDFLERHRGDCWTEVREDIRPGDGLEIADLMLDVRDAVVLENEPRVQLRFRFRQFGRRDAVARDLAKLVN